MFEKLKKSKLILNSLGVFLCLALVGMYGCGKLTGQQSASSILGSASPNEMSQEGGDLYLKYKDKFPDNLMEMTTDELMSKLVAHIVQAPNGEELEVYATIEGAQELAEDIESSYPEHDPEEYANKQVEEMIKDHPAFANMIMNGAEAPDMDKLDISEEEFKEAVLEELETKSKRLNKEKAFILVSELASPEVQAQIKASVSEINTALASNSTNTLGQYFYMPVPGIKRTINKNEMRLLIRHFYYIAPSLRAITQAWVSAPILFGKHEDNKKSNASLHSYMSYGFASNIQSMQGKKHNIWWAKALSDAHEKYDDNWTSPEASMDLHNNRVGIRLFDEYAKDKKLYARVKIGRWTVIDIHYATMVISPPPGIGEATLANRALNHSAQIPTDRYTKYEKKWRADSSYVDRFSNYSPDQLIYLK